MRGGRGPEGLPNSEVIGFLLDNGMEFSGGGQKTVKRAVDAGIPTSEIENTIIGAANRLLATRGSATKIGPFGAAKELFHRLDEQTARKEFDVRSRQKAGR